MGNANTIRLKNENPVHRHCQRHLNYLVFFAVIKIKEQDGCGLSIFLGNLLSLCNDLLNTSNHVERLFEKVIVFPIQHSLSTQNTKIKYESRSVRNQCIIQTPKFRKWNSSCMHAQRGGDLVSIIVCSKLIN